MGLRAALPAEPCGRRGALPERGPARRHRRHAVTARHTCGRGGQALARARPHGRDATHRRGRSGQRWAATDRWPVGIARWPARAAHDANARRRGRHRRARSDARVHQPTVQVGGGRWRDLAAQRRAQVRRRQPRADRIRSALSRHRRHAVDGRPALARLRLHRRPGRGDVARGQRRGRWHRRSEPGLWHRARHHAGLRHNAHRRGRRLRHLLPHPGPCAVELCVARRQSRHRLAALGARWLAHRAPGSAHLGVRLSRAGLLGLRRPGPAWRVLHRRALCGGVDHALRAARAHARRRQGCRPAAPAGSHIKRSGRRAAAWASCLHGTGPGSGRSAGVAARQVVEQ